MYADDLLLISSTCGIYVECCRQYLTSPRYTVPSLLILRYFSDTGTPRMPSMRSIECMLFDSTYDAQTRVIYTRQRSDRWWQSSSSSSSKETGLWLAVSLLYFTSKCTDLIRWHPRHPLVPYYLMVVSRHYCLHVIVV